MPARRRKKTTTTRKYHRRSRKKSFKHRSKIIGLALLVVVSTLLLTAAVSAWQVLNKPLVWAEGEPSPEQLWHQDRSLRILIVGVDTISHTPAKVNTLAFLSLNPGINKATLVNLPLEVLFTDAEPLIGEDVSQLSDYVSQRVQYPFERYLIIDQAGWGRIESGYGGEPLETSFGLSKIPVLVSLLSQAPAHSKTDLSLWEGGRVIYYLYSLRADGWASLDWSPSYFDPGQLLFDTRFYDEGYRITVLNGTPVPGLASRVAQLIKNLGGHILEAGNADHNYYQESMVVGEDLGSFSSGLVKSIFGARQTKSPATMLERRSDLTLIVGLDNARY